MELIRLGVIVSLSLLIGASYYDKKYKLSIGYSFLLGINVGSFVIHLISK